MRSVLTFILFSLALLICCIFVLLDRMYELDLQSSIYSSYHEAQADGIFDRGWIPHFIPVSSHHILEVHNVDTNEICAQFTIDPLAEGSFMTELRRQGFDTYEGAAPPPRQFSSAKPCPFGAEELRSIRKILWKPEQGRKAHSYFAFGRQAAIVYYWVVYDA